MEEEEKEEEDSYRIVEPVIIMMIMMMMITMKHLSIHVMKEIFFASLTFSVAFDGNSNKCDLPALRATANGGTVGSVDEFVTDMKTHFVLVCV